MTTIPERVAAGVAFLDEKAPGWEHKIDLSVLDLADCTVCVLGQAFGSDAGLYAIFVEEEIDAEFNGNEWPPELGFNASTNWVESAEADREYADLHVEWRRVIRARIESEPWP